MTLKQIIGSGILIAGLAGLTGCYPDASVNTAPENEKYFVELPSNYEGGIALVAGDFDNDGDLDIVQSSTKQNGARLYFLENDGKGNFTIRNPGKYQLKAEKQ